MRVGTIGRLAAVLIGVEAVGVLVIAGIEAVQLGALNAAFLPSAIALLVLTIVFAGGLAAFSYGIGTDRSWARSGSIVAQLLLIAIAVGSLPVWSMAVAIGVPALAVLVIVFLAARESAARAKAAPAK